MRRDGEFCVKSDNNAACRAAHSKATCGQMGNCQWFEHVCCGPSDDRMPEKCKALRDAGMLRCGCTEADNVPPKSSAITGAGALTATSSASGTSAAATAGIVAGVAVACVLVATVLVAVTRARRRSVC